MARLGGKIGSGSVRTARINWNSAVTTAKIATDAVDSDQIASGAIGVEHLNAGSASSGQVFTATSSGLDWVTPTNTGWTRKIAKTAGSGKTIDFTGIPSGIRVIHVMFNEISLPLVNLFEYKCR